MKSYILDGTRFNGVETFYTEVSQVFSFPDYFGRNLDALHDSLLDLDDEIEIIWLSSHKSRIDFGQDATQPLFFSLVCRAMRDVPGLVLRLE